MWLDTFLKVSKGNNLISKSRAFHNVGAAYTKIQVLSHYEVPIKGTSESSIVTHE